MTTLVFIAVLLFVSSLPPGAVAEGHVPVPAVVRLLSGHPDITGIALAGMPAGSPGMAGPQTEPFTVNGFSASAPSEVFAVE